MNAILNAILKASVTHLCTQTSILKVLPWDEMWLSHYKLLLIINCNSAFVTYIRRLTRLVKISLKHQKKVFKKLTLVLTLGLNSFIYGQVVTAMGLRA